MMPPIRPRAIHYAIALMVAFLAPLARAQDAVDDVPEVAPTPAEPVDALGRDTPRKAVVNFLLAVEARDFERAAKYLDEPPFWFVRRDSSLESLAEQLGFVLQRDGHIDPQSVSDAPGGLLGEGQPADREQIAEIKSPSGPKSIFLQRLESEDGLQIWKFAGATVASVPELFKYFSYPPWVDSIAERTPDVSFLGIELFKWVIGLGIATAVYVPLFGLSWIISTVLTARGPSFRRRVRRFLAFPISILIAMVIGGAFMSDLGLGPTARRLIESRTIITILSIWILLASVGLWRDLAIRRLEMKGRMAAAIVLRPLARGLQLIVISVGILFWLSNIGFNITTLLAGLGVGGVAIALALQRPLEDVFGAVTLFSQQPFRVHDFCRVGNATGTVEEIGLRTTRIRTLGKTLISIPNASIASQPIENYSARGAIRHLQEVRLRVDTGGQVIAEILADIRNMLDENPNIEDDTHRVRLKELGEFAFIVEIHAYVTTTDFAEFLGHAEKLNLEVIKAVHARGAHFAEPPELRRQ